MSDEEFLARWSRRKRAARVEHDVAKSAPTEPHDMAPMPTTPVTSEAAAEPELDLASLPPIDSINAATDVTAFLRSGVPEPLTRAALRRAWSADPAIRDFVGLAENAWDFNDPNAMPGFGPLDIGEAELSALVERIVGGTRKVAEQLAGELAQSEDSAQTDVSSRDSGPEPTPPRAATRLEPTDSMTALEPATASVAAQPVAEGMDHEEVKVPRRTHGGALPQ